jgi:hypothetical protein
MSISEIDNLNEAFGVDVLVSLAPVVLAVVPDSFSADVLVLVVAWLDSLMLAEGAWLGVVEVMVALEAVVVEFDPPARLSTLNP